MHFIHSGFWVVVVVATERRENEIHFFPLSHHITVCVTKHWKKESGILFLRENSGNILTTKENSV